MKKQTIKTKIRRKMMRKDDLQNSVVYLAQQPLFDKRFKDIDFDRIKQYGEELFKIHNDIFRLEKLLESKP